MAGNLSPGRRLLAVLCGGFLGTITRYLFSLLIQGSLGKGWPYDILLINVTGAFVLAFLTTLADATFLIGPTRRLFFNVGFLGAYTTFSSLALGDLLLLEAGRWWPAVLYMLLSLVGGVLAVVVGDWLGLRLVRRLKQKMMGINFSETDTLVPSDKHLDVQDDLLVTDTAERQGD